MSRFGDVHVLCTISQGKEGDEEYLARFQWTKCVVDGDFVPPGRCWHSACTLTIEVPMEELQALMASMDIAGGEDEEEPAQVNDDGDDDEKDNTDLELLESMKYRTVTLIFGGHSETGALPAEVLQFDHTKCTWEAMEAEGFPPEPRFGHASVLSDDLATMVSVGGITAAGKV